MADVMKIADHQGWSLEQTIQTLLEGEYGNSEEYLPAVDTQMLERRW